MDHSGELKRRSQAARGFTLIELMVVVAIVAILVAIALPSYHDSVRKGRRGQVKADLVELAQRAERFNTINNSYDEFEDTLEPEDFQSPRTGDPHYEIEVDAEGLEFLLTAIPQEAQTGDVRCMTLTLNQAGEKTEDGTGTVADCW